MNESKSNIQTKKKTKKNSQSHPIKSSNEFFFFYISLDAREFDSFDSIF